MTDHKSFFRLNTIRAKIVCIVLAVAICALLLSAVTAYWGMNRIRDTVLSNSEELGMIAAEDSQEALVSQATASLLEETSAKARITEMKLESVRSLVTLLASYIEPLWNGTAAISDTREPMDEKRMMQYSGMPIMSEVENRAQWEKAVQIRYLFEPICMDNDSISSVYFATVEGFLAAYDKNVGDDLEQTFRDGYDFRTREWYLNAKAGKTTFTATYLDVFGRLMTTCSAPVYALDGTLAGVVAMDILIEDINNIILSTRVGQSGYAFLINNEGMVISSPLLIEKSSGGYEQVNMLEDPDFGPSAAKMITGVKNVTQVTVNGNKTFLAYAPIQSTGWCLGLVLPRNDVVAPAVASYNHIIELTETVKNKMSLTMHTQAYIFIVVLAVVVLFVLVVTSVLSGKFTKPIYHLIDEVGVISGGDLERRIDVHTGDEMELLGNAFNSMTESLRRYIEDLTNVMAEKERIGAELSVATHIQASMLPCIFPPFAEYTEFDIYATMNPAKEVGGDFYDFFLIDQSHLGIVIADVSGKGVPAALFMVIAKTLIKDHALAGAPVEEVFREVNQLLCESNNESLFVTAWMGILDINTGHMHFVNAGHNRPLMSRAGGGYMYLTQDPGFVLAGLEGITYQSGELQFNPGDTLYLYTDGVTEATNTEEELYGETRLQAVLNQSRDNSLSGILKVVQDDIDTFEGEAPQFDDITMLVFQYFGQEEQQV